MIYWCKKCKTPVFDKELQERKLLEKIMDCDYGNQNIWYLGASKYFIDEQIVKVPYRDWYKAKKHLEVAEDYEMT